MKILAIETSCDETAISIISAIGKLSSSGKLKNNAQSKSANKRNSLNVEVLANIISSQVKLHAKWGGVVPNLARREHEKNLIPVLKKALKKAKMFNPSSKNSPWTVIQGEFLEEILKKESDLLKKFSKEIPKIKIPKVDAIAVTYGPGLEPALWAGINFAKALAYEWRKPLIPINHMEGHIAASLLNAKLIKFPTIALLVSGGHTELVLMKKWLDYKIIGQTRDDAVGEAFDKVARMLNLGYPGGPLVSKLASLGGAAAKLDIKLPRPMINSGDFDFSFSGLKTAVLYLIKKLSEEKENETVKSKAEKFACHRIPSLAEGGVRPQESHFLSEAVIAAICYEFQEAAVDVLVSKTIKAAKKYKAETIVIGGGVTANVRLRERLKESSVENSLNLMLPPKELSTDNAEMIAIAAYIRTTGTKNPAVKNPSKLKADGNLKLK